MIEQNFWEEIAVGMLVQASRDHPFGNCSYRAPLMAIVVKPDFGWTTLPVCLGAEERHVDTLHASFGGKSDV